MTSSFNANNAFEDAGRERLDIPPGFPPGEVPPGGFPPGSFPPGFDPGFGGFPPGGYRPELDPNNPAFDPFAPRPGFDPGFGGFPPGEVSPGGFAPSLSFSSIIGESGNDEMSSDFRNSYIDGGIGEDTLIFSGDLSEYSLSFDSNDKGKLIVADRFIQRDGIDKVTGVEIFKFGEQIYSQEEVRQIALSQAQSTPIPEVKRLFNTESGKHLFSSNQTEVDYLIGGSLGWIDEGTAYKNTVSGDTSVFRFMVNGSHFYTANESERDLIISSPEYSHYVYEGEAHKAFKSDLSDELELIPVRRFYSINTDSHVFSSSKEEQSILAANPSFIDEGIAWYSESAI